MTIRLIAAVLGVVCLAGCVAETADLVDTTVREPGGAITVASFDFTESRVVGEIYAQALAAWGYPVAPATGGAPRELIEPALEQGLVDLVPEYAGSALQFLVQRGRSAARVAEPGSATRLSGDPMLPSADPDVTHRRLQEAFAERGVAVLDGAPAQNQNALAVLPETAARYGLSTVSDLRPVAPAMVLGGPPECPTRPLCMVGYANVYRLRFRRFAPLDVAGPLTLAALQSGEIDVAVLFTGDRSVVGGDVVFLADDRGLQPAENLTPVVRQDVLEAFGPELRRRLDRLTPLLTSADVARLVRAVDIDREDPARVAHRWLGQAGLAATGSSADDERR